MLENEHSKLEKLEVSSGKDEQESKDAILELTGKL